MTMLNFNWPQKHYILILSTMMIAMSKLTTRLFRQGLLLQGRFPISESNVSNPLHYRIFQTNTWKDFIHLMQSESKLFTADVLASTTKHIISLANKDRAIDYKEFGLVIELINDVDVKNLQPKNIVSLLAMLRTFSNKGYSIASRGSLKVKLAARYEELLKENKNSPEDISTLIFGFFEMIYLRQQQAIQMISQRLVAEINKDYTNQNLFTPSQIGLLIHCLKEKGDFHPIECRIFSYLMSCITSKLELMKFKDVLSILIDIGYMDSIDLSPRDFKSIKDIGQFVLDKISDIDEKSIYQFLKGTHFPPHSIYHQITKELVENVFHEITEDGTSTINHQSLFKILTFLSNRSKFDQYSPYQKSKYFNFVKKYAKEEIAKEDTQSKEYFFVNLANLLNNGHWDQAKESDLIEIIKSVGLPPKLNLIEALFARKADLTPFLQALTDIPLEKLTPNKLFRVALMTKSLGKDTRYDNYKQKIEIFSHSINSRVTSYFSSPEEFNFFMRDWRAKSEKEPLDLRQVDRYYRDLFMALPDPFHMQTQNKFYQNNYLSFLLTSRSNKEIMEYYTPNQENFTQQVLISLINMYIDRNLKTIEPCPGLLLIVRNKLDSVLQEKNQLALYKILDLLAALNRYAIFNTKRSSSIFALLHRLLDSIDILNELSVAPKFNIVLVKYLSRNLKNYSVESEYRKLLAHSISKLSNINNFPTQQTILENGLRLGFLNENVVKESIKQPKFYFLLNNQILYLLDSTFTPKLTNVNPTNLILYCTNKNLGPVMVEKMKEIIEIIPKVRPQEICTIITNWNHPYIGQLGSIFRVLLQQLLQTKANLDSCNLVGVLDHILKHNVYYIKFCKPLAEKILALASQKSGLFSTETHSKFIQFIGTQPGLQPLNYITELLNSARVNQSSFEYIDLLLSASLTNYGFTAKDLSLLPTILKKHSYEAVRIFLSYEDSCEEALKKDFLSQLGQMISNNNYFLSGLFLNYLKRHYPTETAEWTIPEEKLYRPLVSVKSRSPFIEMMKLIAKDRGVSEQIEVKIIDNNIVYQIGDKVILFLTQKHNGAFYEHKFVKKAIREYFVEQNSVVTDVVAIGKASTPQNFISYVSKQLPNFISPELIPSLEALTKRPPPKEKQEGEEE